MLIIPEIETVVILNPRTATGTLYREALEVYPRSMLLYRHMEADGVPMGYDRWPKVGVVREPISRLHSLWSFLRKVDARIFQDDDASYKREQAYQAALPFEDWLLSNREPFSCPDTAHGTSKFWAGYTQRWQTPVTCKSQYAWLRPDLGTAIYRFDDLDSLRKRLGLFLSERHNDTGREIGQLLLSQKASEHFRRYFEWDIRATA